MLIFWLTWSKTDSFVEDYCKFLTILSFADPITDILTLVEFYRADHKTWFDVGLTFVLLPCFVFQVLFVRLRTQLIASPSNLAMKTAFCALRPFSVALTRLEFLKKLLFKLR